MDYPPGQCFFHYTTRKAAFEHILPEKKLRFSLYRNMRDPLESQPWTFAGAYFIDESVKPGEPDPAEAAFFQFNRLANYIRERSHLLAFTIDAEGYGESPNAEYFARGWSRARMWEQYAENHQGACLVFNREKLIASITRSLQDQGRAAPYYKKVEYTETGTADLSLNLGGLAGNVSDAVVQEFIEQHKDELFFLKTLDWETEHEYRFSTTSEDGGGLFVDYADSLEAVIVGQSFPDWERPGAIEACRHANADALRLDWSSNGRPIPAMLRVKRPPDEDSPEDRLERLRTRLQEAQPRPPSA
jgi:hypothetical protein